MMQFPNAFKGVKRIFTSEILSLLAALCAGVATVFAAVAEQQINQGGADNLDVGTAFGVMIPVLIAAVIEIVAAFMLYFGLKDAAKDDENFQKGYYFALAGLVLSIVLGFLTSRKIGGEMLSDIGNILSNFVSVVITFYVINGIKSLADKLGDQEMSERGKKVFTIYAAAIIGSSVISLISTFINNNTGTAIAGVLALVTLVLAIVGYILYLSYLSKAKKMLG